MWKRGKAGVAHVVVQSILANQAWVVVMGTCIVARKTN